MNNKIVAIGVVIIMLVAGIGVFMLINGNFDNNKRQLLEEELQIYGNANGDQKINADDVAYLEKIISGDKEKTKYADANNDGTMDQKDIDQVQSLIDNSAKYIWLVDGDGNDKKVGKDINRIGCEYYSNTELMLILGLKDKVYAIDNAPYQAKHFYFGNDSSVKNMVNMNSPDYEMIEEMNLDVLLTFSYSGSEVKQEKLPDVDVIYLGMYRPDVVNPTISEYFQGILKAGYIFNVVERAEAYMNWLLEIREKINDITSKISESDKPTVLMTNYTNSYFQTGTETSTWSVYTSIDPMGQSCILAGGHPVAKDILTEERYNGGSGRTIYSTKVSPESIVSTTIDYVFCHCVKYTYGGVTMAGPVHGYGVSDPTEMNEAYATAKSRDMVKIDNIDIIAGDFRNGASGCMLLAAYMAKILHPDKFQDMNPLDYHQQYVSDWMGIKNYDIRTDGVFISPVLTT